MTSPTNIGEPIRRELNTGITKKTRIEFIDLAKGVCILLVVIVHVIPELDTPLEFLACLRMPLYFCLSGLFFKDYFLKRCDGFLCHILGFSLDVII